MKPVFLRKLLLLILPISYLVLSIIYLKGIKQFYINTWDPTYLYLINGTTLASGHLHVGNIIPPGTPVECFTAIVIFIKHLFTGGSTVLYQDVLLHPESYLFACSTVIIFLLSLVTYLTGTYMFRHSGSMGLALLFQSSPLFFSDMLKKTIPLSAESFITIYGIFFISYLYINTIGKTQTKKTTTNKNIVLFGLFTALLFTTKIYCGILVLLLLFMIGERKQILIYLISMCVFSLILLFPLYGQLRNWAGNIKSILFHDGFYGQGDAEIINPAHYKNNIIDIFTSHFIFTSLFIVVFAALIVIIRRRKTNHQKFYLPIIGITLFFTVFIVIIAKHYAYYYFYPLTNKEYISPNFYYFMPVLICFPLFITVSYKALSPLIHFKIFRVHKQKLLYGIFIIFIFWGWQQTYASDYASRSQNVSLDKTQKFLNEWKNTPTIIFFDGDKSCVEVALSGGLPYAGKWLQPVYLDYLRKAYPNSYLYETWNNGLFFWGLETDLPSILKKKNEAIVYFTGTDSTIDAAILKKISVDEPLKTPIHINQIYSNDSRYERIYLVKADTLHNNTPL